MSLTLAARVANLLAKLLPSNNRREGTNAAKTCSAGSARSLRAECNRQPRSASGLAHVASLTYAMTAGVRFPIRFVHQRRREKFFTGS